MASKAPASLAKFQQQFAEYLRAPAPDTLPSMLPPRQSQVYAELLFHNICGFIDKCFPVAKSLFNESKWRTLCRNFYQQWPSRTPFFHKIPLEFVSFIASEPSSTEIQPWLSQLLHYEWLELQVQTHPETVLPCTGLTSALKLNKHSQLQCNPTLQIAQYDWPVQRLCAQHIPSPQPTFLLVFRNSRHQVKFIEANAITATLVSLLQQAPAPLLAIIKTLTYQLPDWTDEQLLNLALPTLEDLVQQEVLCPTYAL